MDSARSKHLSSRMGEIDSESPIPSEPSLPPPAGRPRPAGPPPARTPQPLRRAAAATQFPQFVVHHDADGLEHPRCRVNAAGLGRGGTGHDGGQFAGAADRTLHPHAVDGTGYRARFPLLAEAIEDVGQALGRPVVDDLVRGQFAVTHAHVQRSVMLKRKAARRLVKLWRGHAEIHGNTVNGGHAGIGQQLHHVAEAALQHRQALTVDRHVLPRRRDGRRITIDGNDPAVTGIQPVPGIAAETIGAIHVGLARRKLQALRHRPSHDRDMTVACCELRRRHCSSPSGVGASWTTGAGRVRASTPRCFSRERIRADSSTSFARSGLSR